MSKLHIEYVRNAIDERYVDLLDMSDLPKSTSAPNRRQAYLSRGLAALAVQIEHQIGPRAAAACVFDGADDRGLDAMSVDLGTPQPRICLVQAKWSDAGKGAFDEEAVHKLLRGLDLLLDRAYSKFNSRFQPLVPDLQQAFDQGMPKVTIVLALMRTASIDAKVRELLEETTWAPIICCARPSESCGICNSFSTALAKARWGSTTFPVGRCIWPASSFFLPSGASG